MCHYLHGSTCLSLLYSLGGIGMKKWIDVKEQLPTDGDVILVCSEKNKVFPSTFKHGRFERYFDIITPNSYGLIDRIQSIYYTSITHWMPLPEPPKK